MAQPVKILGPNGLPARQSSAYTGGSWDHPDMRRWVPSRGSADTDLNPELDLLRARSRDLTRNHGVAEGAVQTQADNVVGCGLRLKSRPAWKALGWTEERAEEWSNAVEAAWCAYSESTWIDAARSLNFHGLTTQAFRSGFTNGEALALPLWLPDPGSPAATCLQMIEPDRLGNPNGRPDSLTLREGIEIDEYGAPRVYWIRKSHPGDRYMYAGGFSSDAVPVPAYTPWGRKRVIHVHAREERVGQSRGKPQLASVLRQFKVLGDYTNAELKAAVVNAMVAIITKSSLSQEGLVELLASNPDALSAYQQGLSERKRASVDFNAGMILPLGLGEDFASFTPGRPSTAFEAFVQSIFKHIAAGLNMPYELLMKDFSQTNYSSARAALLEAFRFFRGRRRWLATYWAQPVFELWFEEQVMMGAIEAPDFYAKRAYYCRTKWIGDGRGWVDPLKEAQAAEKRMSIGITTLEDECAEQGGDWEEVLEQRAREQRRAEELDLDLPWMSGYSEPVAATETDEELDPATGQAREVPQYSARRTRRVAQAQHNHVHLPDSLSHSVAHSIELKGVQEMVAQSTRTAESVAAIAEEASHSLEATEALAAETRRSAARVEAAAVEVKRTAAAIAGALDGLAAATKRAAYRVPVRDQAGKLVGTRPATAEEINHNLKAGE